MNVVSSQRHASTRLASTLKEVIAVNAIPASKWTKTIAARISMNVTINKCAITSVIILLEAIDAVVDEDLDSILMEGLALILTSVWRKLSHATRIKNVTTGLEDILVLTIAYGHVLRRISHRPRLKSLAREFAVS
jgi:hypothetical protein